jgi:hypothetical protein
LPILTLLSPTPTFLTRPFQPPLEVQSSQYCFLFFRRCPDELAGEISRLGSGMALNGPEHLVFKFGHKGSPKTAGNGLPFIRFAVFQQGLNSLYLYRQEVTKRESFIYEMFLPLHRRYVFELEE